MSATHTSGWPQLGAHGLERATKERRRSRHRPSPTSVRLPAHCLVHHHLQGAPHRRSRHPRHAQASANSKFERSTARLASQAAAGYPPCPPDRTAHSCQHVRRRRLRGGRRQPAVQWRRLHALVSWALAPPGGCRAFPRAAAAGRRPLPPPPSAHLQARRRCGRRQHQGAGASHVAPLHACCLAPAPGRMPCSWLLAPSSVSRLPARWRCPCQPR